MKKNIYIICILLMILFLSSCQSEEVQKPEKKMKIIKAELTEEEKDIVDLIGMELDKTIFDFTVDETIESVTFHSYHLEDGNWKKRMDSRTAFNQNKGRIALIFTEDENNTLRIAIQGENKIMSIAQRIQPTDEFDGMSKTTSYFSNDTEIVYEKEIPLLIQISTTKNEIISYNVEYFHQPEKYQTLGYEDVYAITVTFSKKMNETRK